MKSMKYLLLLAVLGGFSTLRADDEASSTEASEEVVLVEEAPAEETPAADAE